MGHISKYKNVFYIGDAFYTFPPTMAQGSSQAIEAANEISDLIVFLASFRSGYTSGAIFTVDGGITSRRSII